MATACRRRACAWRLFRWRSEWSRPSAAPSATGWARGCSASREWRCAWRPCSSWRSPKADPAASRLDRTAAFALFGAGLGVFIAPNNHATINAAPANAVRRGGLAPQPYARAWHQPWRRERDFGSVMAARGRDRFARQLDSLRGPASAWRGREQPADACHHGDRRRRRVAGADQEPRRKARSPRVKAPSPQHVSELQLPLEPERSELVRAFVARRRSPSTLRRPSRARSRTTPRGPGSRYAPLTRAPNAHAWRCRAHTGM